MHRAVSALMERMSKLTKSDGTDISLCAGAGKKIKPGVGGEHRAPWEEAGYFGAEDQAGRTS